MEAERTDCHGERSATIIAQRAPSDLWTFRSRSARNRKRRDPRPVTKDLGAKEPAGFTGRPDGPGLLARSRHDRANSHAEPRTRIRTACPLRPSSWPRTWDGDPPDLPPKTGPGSEGPTGSNDALGAFDALPVEHTPIHRATETRCRARRNAGAVAGLAQRCGCKEQHAIAVSSGSALTMARWPRVCSAFAATVSGTCRRRLSRSRSSAMRRQSPRSLGRWAPSGPRSAGWGSEREVPRRARKAEAEPSRSAGAGEPARLVEQPTSSDGLGLRPRFLDKLGMTGKSVGATRHRNPSIHGGRSTRLAG